MLCAQSAKQQIPRSKNLCPVTQAYCISDNLTNNSPVQLVWWLSHQHLSWLTYPTKPGKISAISYLNVPPSQIQKTHYGEAFSIKSPVESDSPFKKEEVHLWYCLSNLTIDCRENGAVSTIFLCQAASSWDMKKQTNLKQEWLLVF